MKMTYGSKTVLALVTMIFLLMGVSIQFLMARYRTNLLEPRLEQEARSQAEILARSQAGTLTNALLEAEKNASVSPLVEIFDELLLLNDPETQQPFFESIELQVDYDVVRAEEGSLDIRRGNTGTGDFVTEVPLFNPETYELIGIAVFRVSDRFFRQLSGDIREELRRVSLAVMAILVFTWAVSLFILRMLHNQTLERLRAERELYQQEKKYERLVGSLSSYFVYGKNGEGRLTFVSDSVRNVLGLSPNEFIARHGESLEIPDSLSSNTAETVFDVELPDQHGEPHHLELSEVRVRDEEGRPGGFDGIARDVTTQRQFQEELRLAKDLAEAANDAKSMFLANMSHEIRTPLNAIVGMTALALKGEISPKLRQQLGKIRSSARLLTDIIEDILDLSRIEAGRMELQRTEFDLDDLLADLSDVVGMRIEHRNLEVLFAADPSLPRRLRGDPVRLKQVLLNLLNNALKFTTSGEVMVEIVPVEIRRELAEIRFSVRDTGIGIEPVHLEHLFEPFTQVDGSMTRRFGGAGLGLAISRRLVSMMGGKLTVESTPGEGSTFSFTATFDLPRGAFGPRRLADELRGLPVLVADDNPHARAAIGDMLRSLSCNVTEVASGEEAVERVRSANDQGRPFRLVVLDWMMPGLDGTETAARINELDTPSRIPAILVTAFDRDEATRRAEAVGIEIVLNKPVSPSMIHDAVIEVFDPTAKRDRTHGPSKTIRFTPDQHVLLVEDNEINREVAREFLEASGLTVTEAQNGREALDILETESFDAVLLDIQMPELDGIETVKLIREHPDLRDLPVIAMTAHAMLGDRERFLEAGMSDYVSKPIEEVELMEVLARRLAYSEMRTEQRATAADWSVPDSLPGLEVSEGVRRASGNRRLYRMICRDFRDRYREFPERLSRLLREDEGLARSELHTLKGASGTLGARSLARAVADAETALRNEGPGAVAVESIANELAATLASIGEIDPEVGDAETSEGNGDEATASDLHAVLDQLENYLTQNNLAALECFGEVRRLADQKLRPIIQELNRSLDQLDFETARTQVGLIRSHLSSQPREG